MGGKNSRFFEKKSHLSCLCCLQIDHTGWIAQRVRQRCIQHWFTQCIHGQRWRYIRFGRQIWGHRCALRLWSIHIGQTAHLQQLCRFQEIVQLLMTNMHLTIIHKTQQILNILSTYITQYNNRMFAWISFQQFTEVWAACTEHHFMCGERSSITGQCHINEVFFVAQMPEWREDRALEIVPLESVLLVGLWWWYRSFHFCCCCIIVFGCLQQCRLSHFLVCKSDHRANGCFSFVSRSSRLF